MLHLLRRPWLALCLVAALAAAIGFPGAGADRPLDAHEAYVARTATEMRRRGDWILPYFNAEPRLQKPPLSYWLAMGAHALGGADAQSSVSEREARAPSAIAGIALVLLTCSIAWLAFGEFASGLLAGAMLMTTSAFVIWTHSAQPEMLYAACTALELLGFMLARRFEANRPRALACTLLAWLGFGAAILAKGPLLPLFVLIGAWIGMFVAGPRSGLLRVFRPVLGLLVVAGVCAPWVLIVVRREPHAIEFWRSQMFDRTGGVGAAWWQPLQLLYVGRCAKLVLPWTLLMIPALVMPWRRARAEGAAQLTLWFAFVVPMLCLSFSAGGKGYYLLPVLPCIAALMAGESLALARRWTAGAGSARRVAVTLRAHAVLAVLGAGGAIAAAPYRWKATGETHDHTFTLAMFGIAFAISVWALCAPSSRPHTGVLRTLASFCALFVGLADFGLDFTPRRTLDGEFARGVGRLVPAERKLLVIDGNSQVLLYYGDHLNQPIPIDRLEAALQKDPDAFLVDSESHIEHSQRAGRVLLREVADADEVARVLFEFAADGASGGGTTQR